MHSEVVPCPTSLDLSFQPTEYLGSLAFAPSERTVLYTAEEKVPETDDPFEKFRFRPDFGEGLTGKRRPAIFLFSWQSDGEKSLAQLNTGNEDGVKFGQAIFSPNSERIIYATGYEFAVDGRILGPKGCYNRPTGIWQLRLSDPVLREETKKGPTRVVVRLHKLSPGHLSCRSPRALRQDDRNTSLIWLADKSGGAHLGTSSLFSLDITSDLSADLQVPSQREPLVGVVNTPQHDGFPGLYPPYNLPTSLSVLSDKGSNIVLQSSWGSRSTILRVSADDGKVTNLTPLSEDDGNLYSWSILAANGFEQIICSRSSPSSPYEILLGQFGTDGSLFWRSLDKPVLPDSSQFCFVPRCLLQFNFFL